MSLPVRALVGTASLTVVAALATVPAQGMEPARQAAGDPVVVAAGDIACDPPFTVTTTSCRHGQTARLLSGAARVLTLGDNQYEHGAYEDFLKSYDPTWGAHKANTRPVPGNHEYHQSGAAGYFKYFGVPSYYSFEVGAWHLIALNSNVAMGEGSAQNNWLEADLAAHPNRCVLAYWHHPRYSAGSYFPGITATKPLWEDLLRAKADVVLGGHDHNYQRWVPMDNSGARLASGIRQFIVGTGGKNHYTSDWSRVGTKVAYANGQAFGVLRLTLHATSYDWAFVREGGTVIDPGTANCS